MRLPALFPPCCTHALCFHSTRSIRLQLQPQHAAASAHSYCNGAAPSPIAALSRRRQARATALQLLGGRALLAAVSTKARGTPVRTTAAHARQPRPHGRKMAERERLPMSPRCWRCGEPVPPRPAMRGGRMVARPQSDRPSWAAQRGPQLREGTSKCVL